MLLCYGSPSCLWYSSPHPPPWDQNIQPEATPSSWALEREDMWRQVEQSPAEPISAGSWPVIPMRYEQEINICSCKPLRCWGWVLSGPGLGWWESGTFLGCKSHRGLQNSVIKTNDIFMQYIFKMSKCKGVHDEQNIRRLNEDKMGSVT